MRATRRWPCHRQSLQTVRASASRAPRRRRHLERRVAPVDVQGAGQCPSVKADTEEHRAESSGSAFCVKRHFFRRIEYKWLVAAAVVTGMFMDIMDTTIVNVALPTLGLKLWSR